MYLQHVLTDLTLNELIHLPNLQNLFDMLYQIVIQNARIARCARFARVRLFVGLIGTLI